MVVVVREKITSYSCRCRDVIQHYTASVMAEKGSIDHPLLAELRGALHRLKSTPQPIRDGQDHLVPFCETLEAVFRDGMKQPNSWFGLNKQDYWCWIEPLQDYYFNEKQNPLLREVVNAVACSPKLRTLQGKGRCFLRVALCQKLVSVPVQHLVGNDRLTQYWYHSHSIISNPALRKILMSLLFEVTEMDFELNVERSSFLDETWIIPVFVTMKLPPIKTLDVKIGYAEGRALIVGVEKDCLVHKAGVEVGDTLDELCGEPVYDTSHGKLKQILMAKSVDATELIVVKKYLPDGSPFYPILRRELLLQFRENPGLSNQPAVLERRPSLIVQTHETCTEYTIVYLGKDEDIKTEPSEGTIDTSISRVLNSTNKPQEIILRVSQSDVAIVTQEKKELLTQFSYSSLCGCGRSARHLTCFALMAGGEGEGEEEGEKEGEGEGEKGLVVFVCEAPSAELAHAICAHVAQGFNRTQWFRCKKS